MDAPAPTPVVSSEEIRERKLLEMSQTVRHIKEVNGMKIIIDPDVYAPATDTCLMLSNIKIKPGDRALDIGTGTGVLAIKMALLGAAYVLGVDLNPRAIVNAEANKQLSKISNVTFIKSDVFENVEGQFDVIAFNPPYADRPAANDIDICFYDRDHKYVKNFFEGLKLHLKPGGTAYIAWSNLSPMDVLPKLAEEHDLKLEKIGHDIGGRGYKFYVYTLKSL